MNKDVLIVILIAIIVTLTYFLFHPSVVTQRKTAKIVPQEQEINISADKLPVNQNEADTVKSPMSPNFRIPDDTGYNNQNYKIDNQNLSTYQAENPQKLPRANKQGTYNYVQQDSRIYQDSETGADKNGIIQIIPHTPVVKREKRTFEDNFSVCSPYKEEMTTEYMGMKMNYKIEIVGWVNDKCVLDFESKMLGTGATFQDIYGEPVEVYGLAPKVRCAFTRSQIADVGDNILEEKTQNRRMLKDPNKIEFPEVKDMSLSDIKLLKILLSDKACKVVNVNDFMQIFDSLFEF